MTGHPPSPLVAAVGLVATAADGLRRLPHALGSAGQAALRRYDELAVRGQHVLSGHPHESADRLHQAAAPGPVAGDPYEAAAPGRVADDLDDPDEAVVPVPEVVPEPPIGRTEPVVLPDDVQEEVAQLTPGADLGHDELPLPDFDHQTVPQLRGRLRTLDLAELVQLRDYEQAHAARVPVLTLLDSRIAKLLADTDR
jgi:hypothetical protein